MAAIRDYLTTMDIKNNNTNRVFKSVYDNKTMTMKGISEKLNLSMPTITKIVKDLKNSGLILEGEFQESTGGRKAMSLVCNPDAMYSIGVDVTKHHINFVIVNILGEILFYRREKLTFENTNRYFRDFRKCFEEMTHSSGVDRDKIFKVGFSIPGIISEDNKRLRYGKVIDYANGDLERFSEMVDMPCVFINDANAGGYAELWHTSSDKNIAYLSLSNSVGGSIVEKGVLYSGDNLKSAEFGHLTIVDNGKQCYCGRKGCLDAYCSAMVLEENGGTLAGFFEKLKRGEPAQKEAWENYKHHLVLAINNIRVMMDCNIILGGYMANYLKDYLQDISDELQQYLLFDDETDFLSIGRYSFEASAIGAALMQVSEFIDEV